MGHWNKAQLNCGTLELGTIQFDFVGIRHKSLWEIGMRHTSFLGNWIKAQFRLVIWERGTVQIGNTGIRHNSNSKHWNKAQSKL